MGKAPMGEAGRGGRHARVGALALAALALVGAIGCTGRGGSAAGGATAAASAGETAPATAAAPGAAAPGGAATGPAAVAGGAALAAADGALAAAAGALDLARPVDAATEARAVRALLFNLLDDAEPPRFADPQWFVVCGERSRVWLGGREVQAGQAVPAGSFVLEWSLDGACPLGPDGPLLDGTLRMLVLREDERGFVPVVLARR